MESVLVIVVVVFFEREGKSFNETMKTDSFAYVKIFSHLKVVYVVASYLNETYKNTSIIQDIYRCLPRSLLWFADFNLV